MASKINAWAKALKKQLYVLYLACKDERVPWHARAVTAFVVAYAFSPIDLIPDFIPFLGLLDDLVLVPLGILLALKLVPKSVLADCSEKAEEAMKKGKPKNWAAGAAILFIWLFFFLGVYWWFFQ